MQIELIKMFRWPVVTLILGVMFLYLYHDKLESIGLRDITAKFFADNSGEHSELNDIVKSYIALHTDRQIADVSYVHERLHKTQTLLKEMGDGRLIVSGYGNIFTELISLAQSTRKKICAINFHPEAWLLGKSGDNVLNPVYSDYADENARIIKKYGVDIRRVMVAKDDATADEKWFHDLLEEQDKIGITVSHTTRANIENSKLYIKMRDAFSHAAINDNEMRFNELNMAVYDSKIMVVVEVDQAHSQLHPAPSRLRISWAEDDIKKFNLCELLDDLDVRNTAASTKDRIALGIDRARLADDGDR